MSGSGYYISGKYLKESLDNTEKAIAGSAAAHVQGEFENDLLQLDDLANTARVQSADKEKIGPALKDYHQRMGTLDHVFFASLDGASINEENVTGKLCRSGVFQEGHQHEKNRTCRKCSFPAQPRNNPWFWRFRPSTITR